MLNGHIRRMRRRTNELLYMAWHTALFSRQNELPKLDTVLINEDVTPKEDREMTPEEQLTMLRVICAAYGGMEVEV